MAELIYVEDDDAKLIGPLSPSEIVATQQRGPLRKLYIAKTEFNEEHAQALRKLESLEELWVWETIGSSALREILKAPRLRELNLLGISNSGSQFKGFSEAPMLEVFRCNCGDLSAADLIDLSNSKSLRSLGAQGADVTNEAVRCLANSKTLEELDLEGSKFRDDHCEILGDSTRLRSVDIGATRISSEGLKSLSRLKTLTSLDLWSTNISNPDLALLENWPQLQYLSIGRPFCAVGEMPRFLNTHGARHILKHPSLKRLWLDGAELSEEVQAELTSRLEWFRYEPVEFVPDDQLTGEHE